MARSFEERFVVRVYFNPGSLLEKGKSMGYGYGGVWDESIVKGITVSSL